MGYYELYQQALDEIDAQGVPDNSRDYYPAVRKRHKELIEQHKPDDVPLSIGAYESDTTYEDRETRIASGEESYQPGGEV